jgi:hypothetical protein
MDFVFDMRDNAKSLRAWRSQSRGEPASVGSTGIDLLSVIHDLAIDHPGLVTVPLKDGWSNHHEIARHGSALHSHVQTVGHLSDVPTFRHDNEKVQITVGTDTPVNGGTKKNHALGFRQTDNLFHHVSNTTLYA